MLAERLAASKLAIVSVTRPTRSADFRQLWKAAFVPPQVSWRGEEIWQVLEDHAFARKAKARIEFDRRRGETGRLFVSTALGGAHIFLVEGSAPDTEWWRNSTSSDLYLVSADWSWCLVMSHEEEMGLGPYFLLGEEEVAI